MSGRLKQWLVFALFLGTAIYALAEDITLTTYYPSPRGVYQELRVGGGGLYPAPTGMLHVVKPTDDGNVALRVDDQAADPTPFVIDQNGNVGIGTASPTQLLDVNGPVRIRGGNPDAGEVLTATDATGVASWEYALIPSGFVGFFNLPACPAGWSVYAAGQGRYLVGMPAGGTLGGIPLGPHTPLSDRENRPVGRHAHPVDDPGHVHDLPGNFYVHYVNPLVMPWLFRPDAPPPQAQTDPATTGITIGDAGTVDGTPAPYIQLLACQKD